MYNKYVNRISSVGGHEIDEGHRWTNGKMGRILKMCKTSLSALVHRAGAEEDCERAVEEGKAPHHRRGLHGGRQLLQEAGRRRQG